MSPQPKSCLITGFYNQTYTLFFSGHDEDGDVYKPKNILSLERYVMKMTEGKGVHFVMADGVSDLINT